MSKQFKFDVVIVGSGAAGLSLALNLPTNVSIAILDKNSFEQYASYSVTLPRAEFQLFLNPMTVSKCMSKTPSLPGLDCVTKP